MSKWVRRPVGIITGGTLNIGVPRYSLVSEGTLLESFDTVDGWSAGTGTREVNTTQVYEGSASMKITSGVGTATLHDKTVNWDLSSGDNFKISIYNHGAQADVDNVTFYFALDAGFAQYFSGYKQAITPGWNHIIIRKSDLAASGGAVWTSPIVKIRIRCFPTAGNVSILSLDRLQYNTQMKPFVVISFDDATVTNYTKGFSYIRSKNMVATFFAITDLIDTAGFLTSAQLQEMHISKMDIGNHTSESTDLTTLSQAAAQALLTNAETALNALGLSRASNHVAYPYGQYNDTVEAAMTAAGMLTGRTVSGTPANDYTWPLTSMYRLPARNFDSTISLATAKGYIDTLVSTKRGMNFLFHILNDSTAGENTWKTSDFQELMDYIASSGVQTLTISEWYRAQSASITVHHR